MQPADSSLQSKEVPLETFFHKIVMIRNNLRVLEQKVNASDKLSEADKFDPQQYITRCYGSLTTFNILFKHKDDQFRTSAVDKPNGRGTQACWSVGKQRRRLKRSRYRSKAKVHQLIRLQHQMLTSTTGAAIIEIGKITKSEDKKK